MSCSMNSRMLTFGKCHIVQIDAMLTLQNVSTSELPSNYVDLSNRYYGQCQKEGVSGSSGFQII
jgi:hypothetical protein